jgi:hypothetical protein
VQESLTEVDKDLVFNVIIGLSVDDYDKRSFLIFLHGHWSEIVLGIVYV